MTLGRRIAARMLGLLLAVAGARAAGAQGIVLTISPSSPLGTDSITAAPTITVQATPGAPQFGPFSIQLEVSRDPQFRSTLFSRARDSLSAQFTLDSLLPQKTPIFFRARLFDRFGAAQAQAIASRTVRSWLALVSPTNASNVIFTRRPTFEWDGAPLTLPPGPWDYVLTIFNVGLNRIEQQLSTSGASTFVTPVDLDACTSYRWSVTARAVNGTPADTITVASPGTFVIQSADCPSATISYQNFPNPFGRGTLSDRTCFWFDLAHRTTVRLMIYDLRLHPVKQLVPGLLPALLDSGAYGRKAGTNSGCDPSLSWDGTDDRGHTVPPGVYISVFEADGRRETKKFVFKGR